MAKRKAGGGSQTKFKGGNKPSGQKGVGKAKGKGHNWKRRRPKDDEGDEFAEVDVGYQHEMEESEGDESDKEMDTRKLVIQQNKKKKSGGFQSMGLSHAAFKGVMKKGYRVPTPIQRKTMPLIMDGKDVVAMARTGSGKTAAFLVPMLERLKVHSAKVGARALILSPTRELALQTLKFTKELGRFTGLKAAIILGGDRMEDQFSAIHENPDIIVATPGRFLHIIMEMNLKLNSVEYVVFDEADRLFEMGFAVQLHEIINRLPESRQTLLFSATLPKLLVDFAKAGLTDPALVRLDVDSKLSSQLKLAFFTVRTDDKEAILLNLLQSVLKPSEQTLIFAATRHHVDYLSEDVGIECSYVYSTLDPTARKINIGKFQHKKTMVMIVTDVAARGIDIPMLDNVINYNFPAKPKLFIHRVGRVARAGRSGTAYSIVAGDELPYVLDLHLFLGRPLKLARQHTEEEDPDGVLGAVPQDILDGEEASLRASLENSHDLSSLKKVAENGHKQYVKSRPLPSAESVKRAKELNISLLAPHPLLASQAPAEISRANILEGVRNFKPRQTIFEVAATSKTSAQAVMASKRKRHSRVIEKAQQATPGRHFERENDDLSVEEQRAGDEDIEGVFATVVDPANKRKRKDGGGSAKTFRDENYIPHRASDYYEEKSLGLGLNSFDKEASSAVLDIVADENSGYRQTKTLKKWDRKRKKFITIEETSTKKIRTESGARIPASYKKNIYKEWVKRNKFDAPRIGEDEENGAQAGRKRGKKGKSGKKFAPKGGGGTHSKVKPELKSKEQILKARYRKENQMKQQQKGRNKGGKFSKRK